MTEDEALDALAETLIVRTRTGIVLDGDPLFRTAGARELAERARTFLRDNPDVARALGIGEPRVMRCASCGHPWGEHVPPDGMDEGYCNECWPTAISHVFIFGGVS